MAELVDARDSKSRSFGSVGSSPTAGIAPLFLMPFLFVYGSLKRGFSNHHYLHGQQFLSEVKTAPCYRMYDYGGYPAAVCVTENGLRIQGELWEIDENCLLRIDQLEAVDENLYQRARADLVEPHHQWDDVVIYLYQQEIRGLRDAGEIWREEDDQQNPG